MINKLQIGTRVEFIDGLMKGEKGTAESCMHFDLDSRNFIESKDLCIVLDDCKGYGGRVVSFEYGVDYTKDIKIID